MWLHHSFWISSSTSWSLPTRGIGGKNTILYSGYVSCIFLFDSLLISLSFLSRLPWIQLLRSLSFSSLWCNSSGRTTWALDRIRLLHRPLSITIASSSTLTALIYLLLELCILNKQLFCHISTNPILPAFKSSGSALIKNCASIIHDAWFPYLSRCCLPYHSLPIPIRLSPFESSQHNHFMWREWSALINAFSLVFLFKSICCLCCHTVSYTTAPMLGCTFKYWIISDLRSFSIWK